MVGRLIPARAGKTALIALTPSPIAAHPRACGENSARTATTRRVCGSSPRVRGKPLRPVRRGPRQRLIPARAGKTAAMRLAFSETGAHPRACGENSTAALYRTAASGSSPRVRGKRQARHVVPHDRGLIPARAGKTRGRRPGRAHAWAHPRACGENGVAMDVNSIGCGSSPRVRGKRARRRSTCVRSGLIPARAGKTGR